MILGANISPWSYDFERNAEKSGKQYDLTTLQSLNSMTTINSRKKKLGLLENCQTVCSQIVLKSLHLARIDRLDILWSVNKLARAVTKWTTSCD